jgi:HD-GYP domain-containing protein (c-di-GMP phosphodiesterase class II)
VPVIPDGPDNVHADHEDALSVDAACRHAVAALARALELHDYRRGRFAETRRHGEYVTALALRFVHQLGLDLAYDPQLEWGFRLHDIGMLGVSPAILACSSPLDSEQLAEVREHPWLGERIVASVPYLSGVARQVIGSHHEKWDGSGYPRGLSAEEIPLAARLFTLVDAFDVMTNDQPYRQALPFDLALAEIDAKAGTHFDPMLAPPFLRLLEGLELPLHPGNVSALTAPLSADPGDLTGQGAARP